MKSLITFTGTAELDMDSPLFPPECVTYEQMLAYWLKGANDEPRVAMECIDVKFTVTGELK